MTIPVALVPSDECFALSVVLGAMQVLDVHCGFLSNFEVLKVLEEDVAEQDLLVKAFKEAHGSSRKHLKSNAPVKGEPYFDYQDQLSKIVPHNNQAAALMIKTVHSIGLHHNMHQALQYLKQKDLPCQLQNSKIITDILEAIEHVQCNPDEPGARGSNGLTKTEKLMMVNMAPLSLVDLTVIIDDLEVRFQPEAQQELLNTFLEHFGADLGLAPVETNQSAETAQAAELGEAEREHEQTMYGEEMDYDDMQDMPDEENDLVDEGQGDGGRDGDLREIDEVAES